jgi:hypothetical protein
MSRLSQIANLARRLRKRRRAFVAGLLGRQCDRSVREEFIRDSDVSCRLPLVSWPLIKGGAVSRRP